MPSLSRCGTSIRPGVFAELQRRIDAHAARGGDLVPLQIGDTSIDPPAEARFERTDDASLFRYGATAALAELRRAIADWLASARSWTVDPEAEVLVGCGGTHAIFCAARSVLDAGDEVAIAAPYWPLAPGILASCGARVVEVPFTSRLYDDPSLDAGAIFREAIGPSTRAIYLITPNNPDGKVLSSRHLEQIAALARERDLWVFADEVYADHAFDAPHVSIASLPGMRERTITAYSLSKSHALAGARIGYVVAPPEVIACARRVSTHTVFNVPVATQRVATAALRGERRFVLDARDRYLRARDLSVEALRGLPLRFHVAEGGTYLFVDFSPVLAGRSMRELLERAVDQGVLLAPGEAFGAAYATWARLCYSAVDEPRLREGLARLRRAVG